MDSGQDIIADVSDDYKDLFTIALRPQHARDRLTQASAIYHSGEMFFEKGAGIYFLIDGIEEKLLDLLLKEASIKGLGGRRSTGSGVFRYEIESQDNEWDSLLNNQGNAYIILSLFHPDENELRDLRPLAFSIIQRKGWTYSSVAPGQFKRETCRMFGEGSVFLQKPVGCLPDVAPKEVFSAHPVYRFGKAFSIPCTFSGETT